MPKKAPRYRKHKRSGLACVSINGKDVYLGPYGSAASKEKYRTVLAEYYAKSKVALPSVLTITEAFTRWSSSLDIDRRERSHVDCLKHPLFEAVADGAVAMLGPKLYATIREAMVVRDWSRTYVNAQCGRLKKMLRWLVGEELYPAEMLAAVREVPDLRAGKTKAREQPRRQPVPLDVVHATLPHLSVPVRGIVLFQLHTGCRPAEAITVRRGDIDTEGRAVMPGGSVRTFSGVWVYQPGKHKKAHLGKPRYIVVGPKGQAALKAYMGVDAEAYLFRPGDVARSPRPGLHYQASSYDRAVAAGCKRAKVQHWSPYQLRHSVSGLVRDEFGAEHAQQVLGHDHLRMTAHYTQAGLEKAVEAMRKIG